MSLIGLLVLLIVIGLAVYFINTYIPLPAPFKQIILVVAVLVALILVLQAFGVLGSLNVRVPQIN